MEKKKEKKQLARKLEKCFLLSSPAGMQSRAEGVDM